MNTNIHTNTVNGNN